MTTNHPEHEESDMTAATVERPATYARPIGPQPPRFPAPAPIDHHAKATEVPATLRARLAALQASVPADNTDHGPQLADDPEERRMQIATLAWTNSIKAAHMEHLAQHQLEDLAPDQHPVALRQFAASLTQDDPAVLNLVLGGRVGPGKTSSAIAVGNAVVRQGLMARVVRHSDYLAWLRPDGSPDDVRDWQIEKRYRDVALLVLDDLGAGLDPTVPAREFVKSQTMRLIQDRINAGKPTIITTNLPSAVIETMFGAEVLSRISEQGHVLAFTGEDRRGRLTW